MSIRLKLSAVFVAFASGVAAVLIGLIVLYTEAKFVEIPRAIYQVAMTYAVQAYPGEEIEPLIGLSHDELLAHPTYTRLRERLIELPRRTRLMAESEPREDEDWGEAWIMVRTDRNGIGRLLVTIDPDHTGRDYDMMRFPAMMQGWSSVVADPGVTEDEYGRSLSVYAPIKTADGRVVALLGYDGPAGPLDEATSRIVLIGLALFLLVISAAGLVSLLVGRRLTRPLTQLSDAIEQVSAGDLTTTVPVGPNDEIGKVGRHFNEMVGVLREREQLRRTLRMAAIVQQHLLPDQAPEFPGYDIHGMTWPCDETGGDYFDYVRVGETLVVVLGDASGHGVPAALIMASTRSTVRAFLRDDNPDLAVVLHRVNQQLVHDTPAAAFFTLALLRIDRTTGAVSYASAGHEPILIARRHGVVEQLPATGIPLGIDPDARWTAATAAPLAPGEVLLMSSDGLRECASASAGHDEMYGLQRAADRLLRVTRLSAAGCVADLYDDTRQFLAGGRPADDLTLVVVRRLPDSSAAPG